MILDEFSNPHFRAKQLEDRLESFRDSFIAPSTLPIKIGYSNSFGNFRSSYKLPEDKISIDLPVLFQAKIFGSKGVQVRRKLFSKKNCVPFFGKHQEIICDISELADEISREKVSKNPGCFLRLDWMELDKIKDSNQIWNLSYKSCMNKKGEFDPVSWTFFFNTYLDYYYNSIFKFL